MKVNRLYSIHSTVLLNKLVIFYLAAYGAIDFRVVTPKRTFFLQATSIQLRDQWVGILKWKLVSKIIAY